jgi:hypothetical protein
MATEQRSLGRRVAERTTDLLAIAVVVMAGFGLGRQTLRWWGAAEPEPVRPDAAATEWGADGAPVVVGLGGLPFDIIRRELRADAAEAEQALLALVRDSAVTRFSTPPSADEQALLDHLAARRPEFESPGNWQLHRLGGGLPTVFALRPDRRDGAAPAGVAPGPWRLAAWGLLFPARDGAWTLYVVRPAAANAAHRESAAEGLRLPAGCRRLMELSQPGGARWLAFAGSGDATDWMRHFDAVCGEPLDAEWSRSSLGFGRRFRFRAGGAAGVWQVQFVEQDPSTGGSRVKSDRGDEYVGLAVLHPEEREKQE